MLTFISTFLLIVNGCVVHCSTDTSSNICHKEEKYIELQEEKTTQPVRIRSYNWCLSFPPRCSNYRTEIHEVIKLQNVTKTKLIEHCCEGFNNINLNNNESLVCLPICRGGCRQGVCESPNQCVCGIGYEGCRPRMFGKNCKNVCKCRNNSLCDHKSGFCRCTSGWIGELYENYNLLCKLSNFIYTDSLDYSCENPCPKGHYGIMCQKKCQCNTICDPMSGKCLSENAKIVFDVSHNRSSGIMKLSSERIKAKHWIPVNVNGKINFRNCSDPNQCERDNGRTVSKSTSFKQNDLNKTALIQKINSNLSNLTEELESTSDKSLAIIVNASIEIHHIHKNVLANKEHNDLVTPNTKINSIATEEDEMTYDEHIEADGSDQSVGHNSELYDEIDSIGGYNDVVHVFSISSINTTKSEQIQKLPPMVPVTLILLVVICVSFILVSIAIHIIHRRKDSEQTQNTSATHEDIKLSDQNVQKPLPDEFVFIEIPSFTQSITRRLMQQDFYDIPSNNTFVTTSTLGYSYAVPNRYDERAACDEHIYDEIRITDYGKVEELCQAKPFFRIQIDEDRLGSPPLRELLNQLKPRYWFAGHLHCKFDATIPHKDGKETKFMCSDKWADNQNRCFLQIVDIGETAHTSELLEYDLEWLTILQATKQLMSTQKSPHRMPDPYVERDSPTICKIALSKLDKKFENFGLNEENASEVNPPPRRGLSVLATALQQALADCGIDAKT
ncbi:Lariat debranching enzyme B [Pseudolycoriella hygida]|uniref:Lariat debranching enzyme B n=1 Tax=Pseudolycoriella hygida TaxID=35572 RepID=A0A9Q0ND37_9DIPT|nr:Lariat debranching enzyme B [Pseudolycoriella hygida]